MAAGEIALINHRIEQGAEYQDHWSFVPIKKSEADQPLETTAGAEHFARHWLDAARYADTHGIHLDNYRAIWPYRDWVIRAFQANMPWDRFTTEQIAGDMLPDKTLNQLVATGFSHCLATTDEGGTRPSHPKLLDWLAAEFIDSGWDYRHMIQLIASSATYRQSGVVTPEKLELDPANRLLARGPRHRLDAKQIRDLALTSARRSSGRCRQAAAGPVNPGGLGPAAPSTHHHIVI